MYTPRIYREPLGGPLRWQDDVTGVLPSAMRAFLDAGHPRKHAPTAEQLELVRDYFEYYIAAPCWRKDESFTAVEERIKTAKTIRELSAWLKDALKVGIDPI